MKSSALRGLVGALSGKNILVVGDLMLDEYVWGQTRRISPEAPVPVFELQSRTHRPGGAANVAVNIIGFGSSAQLAGVIGQDDEGGKLLGELRSCGVATDGVLTDESRQTTTKTRVIARGQQVLRIDAESHACLSPATEESLLRYIFEQLPTADGCILSDYAKGVVSPRLARGVIRRAREIGKPLVVDPKGTDYAMYRGATVVKPNKQEVERFVNQELDNNRCLIDAGRKISAILDGAALLITLGPDGMLLFSNESAPLRFQTTARSVFDVTGAGDTAITTLTLALAAGHRLDQGVQLANIAAGIVVGKSGAAAVSVEELMREL